MALRSSTRLTAGVRLRGAALLALCRLSGLGAGVLGDELRDLPGILADDDVLRHRAGGEPAVADRVEDVVDVLLALVEVRAVLVLAGADVGGGALRSGDVERVAAAAALLEDLGTAVVLAALGERDVLAAAGAECQRGHGEQGQHEDASEGAGHRGRTAYGTMPRPMPLARAAILVLTIAVLAGCG